MILELKDHPPIQASAILFDLDGTLVESTGSISEILSQWAVSIGQSAQNVVNFSHGKRTIDIVQAFVDADQVDVHYQALTEKFIQSADQAIAVEGAGDFLKYLDQKSVPWAVVSSSEKILIQARLKAAGLPEPKLFVSAEDVEQGKPSPEGYLLAAEKLAVNIQECIVFEDAEAGILAAQRAKAQIVVVGDLNCGLSVIKDYTTVKLIFST